VTSFAPPLDGIRVLELGSSVAGPAAGRLLADLGAEVIKIEPPEGDGLRTWGAPAPDGTGWWFKSHNRNKRFLVLDLREEADRATVRDLVRDADVLIENFRPGRMDAWGLGYDALQAINPGLVYAAISGFGQTGPYAQRAGFGNIAESMGGLRYITGYPDRPPVRTGFSLGDELAGLYCVVGILAALRARERDGVGDFVDTSLLDSCIAMTEGALPEFGALGVVRERRGNAHLSVAPSNIYPTRDGSFIAIGANANGIFRRFTALMGRPELADDPRFCGNQERTVNAEAVDALVSEWTSKHDAAEIAERLNAAGVPAGPLYSIAGIVADEHVRARGIVRQIDDDAGNHVSTTAPVPRLLRHPSVLSHAAKAPGADGAAIVREAAARREAGERS
jgi:crotonobetainyl-CoA:carnitine CoA-transferase CaiB-like acyl-CoA transferase